MDVLEDHDHWCKIHCDCGRVFEADATTEENLEWNEEVSRLLCKCPSCNKLQD
jgi:hypothetical protein